MSPSSWAWAVRVVVRARVMMARIFKDFLGTWLETQRARSGAENAEEFYRFLGVCGWVEESRVN